MPHSNIIFQFLPAWKKMGLICTGGLSRVASTSFSPIYIQPNWIDRSCEYLKRIPEEEWEEVLWEMQRVGRCALPDEIQAFKFGQWDHPVFQEPSWCYSAFDAYLKHCLDEAAMNKLFLYQACCNQAAQLNTQFERHQLRNNDGTINEETFSLLENSINRCAFFGQYNLERIKEMFTTVQPDQTQFFVIGNNNSLFQRASSSLRFCTLDQNTQVVLPPDFVYKILQVIYGKNAMLPCPVLGFCDEEIFSNPWERIICIPSFFKVPNQLHGKEASPLAIYYHDIAYHLLIESANPFRQVWVKFLHFLLQESLNPDRFICKSLIAKVSDRDFPTIVKGPFGSFTTNFWINLTSLIAIESPPNDENDLLILFTEFCNRNRQTLEDTYKLTIQSLEKAEIVITLHGHFPKRDRLFLSNLKANLQQVVREFLP